jgi:hypothetical protein
MTETLMEGALWPADEINAEAEGLPGFEDAGSPTDERASAMIWGWRSRATTWTPCSVWKARRISTAHVAPRRRAWIERVGVPTRPGGAAPDQRASIGVQLRFSGPT